MLKILHCKYAAVFTAIDPQDDRNVHGHSAARPALRGPDPVIGTDVLLAEVANSIGVRTFTP